MVKVEDIIKIAIPIGIGIACVWLFTQLKVGPQIEVRRIEVA